jgi:hypothetical protein
MHREDIEKIFQGLTPLVHESFHTPESRSSRQKLEGRVRDSNDAEASEMVSIARETIRSLKSSDTWSSAYDRGIWGAAETLSLLGFRALPALPELAALDREFQRNPRLFYPSYSPKVERPFLTVRDLVRSIALAAIEAGRLDVFLSSSQLGEVEKASSFEQPSPAPIPAAPLHPPPQPTSSGPAGLSQFLALSRQRTGPPPPATKPPVSSRSSLNASPQTEMMKLLDSWVRKEPDPNIIDTFDMDKKRTSTALEILEALGPAARPFAELLETRWHDKTATRALLTIGPEGHAILRKHVAGRLTELQTPRSPAALADCIRFFGGLVDSADPRLWNAIGMTEQELSDQVTLAREKLIGEIVRNIDVLKTPDGNRLDWVLDKGQRKLLAERLSVDQIHKLSHAGFPLSSQYLAEFRPDVGYYIPVAERTFRELAKSNGWEETAGYNVENLIDKIKSRPGPLGTQYDFLLPFLLRRELSHFGTDLVRPDEASRELARRIWPNRRPVQLESLRPFLEERFLGNGDEFKDLRTATVPDKEALKKWLNAPNREGQILGVMAAGWLKQEVREVVRLIGPEYALEVRAAAAKALGLIGGPEAERALLDTLRESGQMRTEWMRGTVKLRLPFDLSRIQVLRNEAILALGYLGAKQAYQPLIRIIDDRAERELLGYQALTGFRVIPLEERWRDSLEPVFVALGCIAPKSQEAVAKILGLLRRSEWEPVFDTPLLKGIDSYQDGSGGSSHHSEIRRSFFVRHVYSCLLRGLEYFDPAAVLKHRSTLYDVAKETRDRSSEIGMEQFIKGLEKKSGWSGWF